MRIFGDTPWPEAAAGASVARELPLLVVRDGVLFPDSRTRISVGRRASLTALRAALGTEERRVLVVAQRDPADDEPAPDALQAMGCVARVYGWEERRDFGLDVVLLGCLRARWAMARDDGAPTATAELVTAEDAAWPLDHERQAVLRERAIVVAHLSWGISRREATRAVDAMASPGRWADVVLGSLDLPTEERQRWLEELDAGARARFVLAPDARGLAEIGLLVIEPRSWHRRLRDALLW